jgi:hypothetical protein
MSSETVNEWLGQIVRTAIAHDLGAHMNLISRKIRLTGIPGFDQLGYKDWYAQCEHEFEQRLLKSVRYGEPEIVATNDFQIMFRVFETVEATDGKVNAQGVEMLIELEDDRQWRLVQQRVLTTDESNFYSLKA